MKTYIISLDKDNYRRSRIISNMREVQLGCEYEIVSAISGDSLTEAQVAKLHDVIRFQDLYGRQMGRNELACALSHKSVYERMLASDENVAVVFEDDALLSSRLNEVIPYLKNRLNQERPGVIVLSQPDRYRRSTLSGAGNGLHQLCKPESIYGAYGYMLNKHLARLLLDYHTPVFRCSDHWNEFLSDIDFDLMALVPHEVGNIDFDRTLSNLSAERRAMYEASKSNRQERNVSVMTYCCNLPRAVYRRIYNPASNYLRGIVICNEKSNNKIDLG